MSPPDTKAEPLAQVVESLRTGDRRARRQAIEALERCGPEDAHLAPALSQLVLQRVLGAERIAGVLGRMGPGAEVAIPALLGLLEEPVPRRRLAASKALADIGAPAAERAVPRLEKVLTREKDPAVREQVERDLERFASLPAGEARS